MDKEIKKEENDLSYEIQPAKKDWIKPEFKVLTVNNGGSIIQDSTSDQHS